MPSWCVWRRSQSFGTHRGIVARPRGRGEDRRGGSKAQELADDLFGEGSADAVEQVAGELVVLAVPYTEAPHVVREFSDQLAGTTIVDPTNPVDFSVVERLDNAWIGDFGSGGRLIAAGLGTVQRS